MSPARDDRAGDRVHQGCAPAIPVARLSGRCILIGFCRPFRGSNEEGCGFTHPAINRWAILGRPSGTPPNGGPWNGSWRAATIRASRVGTMNRASLAPGGRSKMAADASPPLRGRDRFMGSGLGSRTTYGYLKPKGRIPGTLNVQRPTSNAQSPTGGLGVRSLLGWTLEVQR